MVSTPNSGDRRRRPIAARFAIVGMAGAALVALSACGGSNASDNALGGEVNRPTVANVEKVVPENATTPNYNEVGPTMTPTATPTPRPDQTIPTGFQGKWAAAASDCASGKTAGKGLMTIDRSTLQFGGSTARVIALTMQTQDQLLANFAVSGGQKQNATYTLTLRHDGQELVRETAGSNDATLYHRCQ